MLRLRPKRSVCELATVSALLSVLGLAGAAAQPVGYPAPDAAPSTAAYLTPQHLSPEQLSPADQALVRSRQKAIAREAEFFGYDPGAGHWSWDQVVCPEMPDDLLLHYHTEPAGKTQSLFSAVVPRGTGRVQVVPVLYRGATPFHSAVDAERTIAVFNRTVPAEIASEAMQPDGPWLALAVCYAELAGANPRVPQKPDLDPGLLQAPLPTLHLSEEEPNRQEIIFTDRDAPGGYLVWTVTVNKAGRVVSASTRSLADYIARPRSGKEPQWKPMPEGKAPKEQTIPEGKQPKVVQYPQ